MEIRLAKSDPEIAACYPVMRELRPHIQEQDFVSRIRYQEKGGYQLACTLRQPEGVVAAAGFRISDNLAWGRFLYIDDLVTLTSHRSQGLGAALLEWLTDFVARRGCDEIHLDSGIQRADAHRFYERHGFSTGAYHFARAIKQLESET